MLAELSPNSLNTLYDLYRDRFDNDKRLEPMQEISAPSVLWEKLEHEMQLSPNELGRQIAELVELPYQEDEIHPPEKLGDRLPRKTINRFQIIPIDINPDEPVIATANPLDPELIEALSFIYGSHYRLVLAHPQAIGLALETINQGPQAGAEQRQGLNLKTEGKDSAESRATPRLARQIMVQALAQNASDLHVQPFLTGSVVRIRVDGLLKRMTMLPDKVADAMIRYFKAHSGMDPTANMVPQDGRMLVELDGHEYDLRISTLPVTGRKEKLVVRFLNRQSILRLTDIGFSLDEIHAVRRLSALPSGVILVCGPTGSGKTTTLYSILHTLNNEDTSIMTVENPVEYQVQGLSQTEVNDKAGMTFPRALRAILRQDPDTLLIGEIRDEETAQIAMQSALTGHLVFSTLHTNDSLSAIPRLLDLDINPVILADCLSGILSQRLLRTLCKHCKQPLDSESEDPAAKAFHDVTESSQGCRPVGCKHCNFSGYLGRTVVAEIIEVNQAQRELLLGGENDISKFKTAMRGAFISMPMAASRLVISGITSANEATRVLGQQFWLALAEDYQNPLPDLSALSDSGGANKIRNGILIAGLRDETSIRLATGLENSWLDVFHADSPAEAEQALRQHEAMSMVVLDLSNNMTDQEVLDLVADYRRHLAWSRLPALIRLPGDKLEWEALLRSNGATSRFVNKDEPVNDIVTIVQQAVSDKADFTWGQSETKAKSETKSQANSRAKPEVKKDK